MKTTQPNPRFLSFRIRPWGLLAAGGYAGCAATLLGGFAGQAWFLDPFSHFRVQLAAGLVTLALLLLVPRHFKTAALFGLGGLINFGFVLPLYVKPAGPPPENGTPLRTMLVNVHTQNGKSAELLQVIAFYHPDILVLEEINMRWVRELASLSDHYPHHVIKPREDNFGIALYSRFPLGRQRIIALGGSTVPTIITEVEIAGSRLTVLATHPLPPAGRDYTRARNAQLAELQPLLAACDTPVILIGDLNTTPWNPHFRRLLKATGLRNSSKGRGMQPTWPTTTPLLRIPIDHILHSPELYAAHKEIGPAFGSDHYPVVVDFIIRPSAGM